MHLTPEERQRIYEEEKARLEAQQQLQAEAKAKADAEQRKKITYGLLGLGLIVLVSGVVALSSNSPGPPRERTGTPPSVASSAPPPETPNSIPPSSVPPNPTSSSDIAALEPGPAEALCKDGKLPNEVAKDLDNRARQALSSYYALREEASTLTGGAPVGGGTLLMAEYVGSTVRPWYEREHTFQESLRTSVPTLPDLIGCEDRNADRVRALVMGVFANLWAADHLMWLAVSDTMTSCNPAYATRYLSAADDIASKAKLTINGRLTAESNDILGEVPRLPTAENRCG
jgi:hypothetical protein